MKAKVLLLWVLAFAVASCDDSSQEVTGQKGMQEAYLAMQELVAQGDGYDVTNVAELIFGDSGYWQLDAVLAYDKDFKEVETVYRDFAKGEKQRGEEPIVAFSKDGRLISYEMDLTDWSIKKQVGSWSFAPRTLALSLTIPNAMGNEEAEYTLLALTGSSMVLEWRSDKGEAMRASLRPASLSDMQLRSAEGVIDTLMATCKDFAPEAPLQGLPGEWCEDSDLEYDQDWQHVVRVHELMGVAYSEGGVFVRYHFEADGQGSTYFAPVDPSMEPETTLFEWSYNENSGELLLSGSLNATYFVSGYNGDYVVLDRQSADKNLRLILKRRVE